MKLPRIPADEGKPIWGGLVWFLSCTYVFLDPYQHHADTLEWMLTSLGFTLFFCLYALGLVYWSNRRILRGVCIATALLALVFTAYRPSFGLFFAFVAAFAPFTVNGNIGWSATFIAGVVAIHMLEAWLVGGGRQLFFASVIGIESLVVGAGTTFVARQQIAMARAHKTAERERIARDLHDILGHTLSVIILKSELAGKLLAHDVNRARIEIGEIESISRKALSDVRVAIGGYHAGDMQSEFERAHATLHAAGIKVERNPEQIDIPATQERVLVLALREAVTNIVRHAGASRCWIDLRRVDNTYRLQIRDDGRGGITEEGFGIRGMRHRVESSGGSLSLGSDEGTELTITLPAAS